MENKSGYPQPGYIPPQQGYQPGYPPTQPVGFQPPPPNYNQTIGGVPATVIVTQAAGPPLGPSPSQTVCPSCHATILTNVKYEPNTKTHIMALILCCFICWPCVCLPYCMDSCQSANHYCPNCNAYLGAYDKDGC